jgi:RNA polymerase sigma-70 factor (ECF subfamily)
VSDPDAGLVFAAAAGDRAAFAELLKRHYDRVHALAWQLTGSRADADDIAQDVCCTLVEKIGSFRGEAKFTTWLCGITFNACRDLRRRRRSFSGLTERLAVLAGLARAPDGRDLYDSIWLRSAIARLKPALARRGGARRRASSSAMARRPRYWRVAESTVSWRMHEVRRILAAEGGGEEEGG